MNVDATPQNSGPARATPAYMPQLDALRAVAIVFVLISHWAPERIARAAPWGVAGVRLFFVLSGFLITGILLRCRRMADGGRARTGGVAARFYARRLLRIFPVYYATLAAAALLNFDEIRHTFRWHLFYATNLYMTLKDRYPGPAAPFWSLAAEEQFYLLWPWVVLLVPWRALRGTILAAIALGTASMIVTLALGWDWTRINAQPLAALPSLGLGALLALSADAQRGDARSKAALCRRAAAVGLVLFLAGGALRFFYGNQEVKIIGFILGASGMSVWLIDRAARGFGGRLGRAMELKPVLYVGRISYGMYVVHLFAGPALARILGATWEASHGPATRIAVYMAWTLIVASLSWHLLEAPINRLKRFVPYAPRPLPLTPPAEAPGRDAPALIRVNPHHPRSNLL